jgi:hypothetical protein
MKEQEMNSKVAQDYTDDEILTMLSRIFRVGISDHGSKVA